jgi:hypothetical protein
MAVQRCAHDISKHVETQLSEILNKRVYYPLTVDKSTDVTSTAQICIFARGVTSDFEVFRFPFNARPEKKKGEEFHSGVTMLSSEA